MKKIILPGLLVLVLLAPRISKGQIDDLPNYGFETWITGYYPDQWDTASAVSKKGIVFNGAKSGGTVQRLTTFSYTIGSGSPVMVNPHQGSYYVDLATVASQSTGVNAGYIQSKFAYANRPGYVYANIGFFAQAAGEQPIFAVTFTKWNTTTKMRDTVLKAVVEIPNQGVIPPWTVGYLPLATFYNPNLTEAPDTALVQFQSSGGVVNGNSYNYANGTTLLIDNGAFSVNQPAGIEISDIKKLAGVGAFPNPFTGKTTIHYMLAADNSLVNLSVYDMQGREIANLVNEHQVQGPHDATFDGSNLKDGVYFFRLQSDNDVQTGKLILSK